MRLREEGRGAREREQPIAAVEYEYRCAEYEYEYDGGGNPLRCLAVIRTQSASADGTRTRRLLSAVLAFSLPSLLPSAQCPASTRGESRNKPKGIPRLAIVIIGASRRNRSRGIYSLQPTTRQRQYASFACSTARLATFLSACFEALDPTGSFARSVMHCYGSYHGYHRCAIAGNGDGGGSGLVEPPR